MQSSIIRLLFLTRSFTHLHPLSRLWLLTDHFLRQESEYDSEITFVTGSKRKATSLASSSVKRKSRCLILGAQLISYSIGLALVPAGANHYRSTVERTEDSFLVSRIDCTRDGAGVVVWTETSVSTEVSVRQDSSASGNTKQMSIVSYCFLSSLLLLIRMLQLTFERRQYAAKSFYDIGGRPPTPQDNIFHLKAELLCQKQVAHCLTRFQEQAKAHGVSIAGAFVLSRFFDLTHRISS
jgi:hypothetical protein